MTQPCNLEISTYGHITRQLKKLCTKISNAPFKFSIYKILFKSGLEDEAVTFS